MSQDISAIWHQAICHNPLSAAWVEEEQTDSDEWPEIQSKDRLVLLETDASAWKPLEKPTEAEEVSSESSEAADLTARRVLDDLNAMLKEQDEPDFLHRPTDPAYKLARHVIKSAYTHYLGFAPVPAIAPDGDGGLIVEWKSGQREVSLIAAPSKEQKSYVYSRGAKTARIDYGPSGLILAKRLRSTFAD